MPIPPSAQKRGKFPRPLGDACDNPANVLSFATSSTVSLRESVLAYVEENGRTYHAFNEGSTSRDVSEPLFTERHPEYVLPNDKREQERLGVCESNALTATS